MADNFANYYTGNMAPPLKLPGGGYAPAPSAQTQMTPEEIYQGIYGEPLSSGLTSRSVRTVAIDPSTGMPASRPQMTADARAAYGGGIGAGASGSLKMMPNQPSGSMVAFKDQSQLPADPRPYNGLAFGYDAQPLPRPNAAMAAINGATKPNITAIGGARGQLGAMGNMSGSLAFQPRNSDGIIDLTSLNMSEKGAQGIADSEGKPIRAANGKVYYPGGRAPQAAQGRTGAAAAAQQSQQRSGGLGGLLAGLFGGGGQTQQAGGGLGAMLSGMNGGAAPQPTYTTTPFQENAFQTTTGAQMPASMNNSRWLTGY